MPRNLFLQLVHGEVLSKIDYCNVLYYGLPKYQLNRLQVIINKAARLVLGLKYKEPITVHLKKLHWLPIGPRIDFKSILLIQKSLKLHLPIYIRNMFEHSHSQRLSALKFRLPAGKH